MIQHLVFDFDGTLADSEEVCFELFNEMAAEYGYRCLSRAEVPGLKCLAYRERCRRLGIPLLRVPLLAIEARQRYQRRLATLKPFEQIPLVLRQLASAGYRLHILSSNAVANIRDFIRRHDIDVFESVVCERNFFGKHIGLGKFMRRHGVRAHEVVYMGDEVRDVDACRKVGIPIFAAGWGFDGETTLRVAAPDGVLATPLEISGMLEAFAGTRSRVAVAGAA